MWVTSRENCIQTQWEVGSNDSAIVRWLLFSCLGMSYILFARVSSRHALPVLCPFRRMTGMRCPLCGFTTATASLLHGDLRAAVRAHPFAPAIIVGVLYWYASASIALLRLLYVRVCQSVWR